MELPLRPFRWDDIDAIVRLARACEAVDQTGTAVTREALEVQFQFPGVDPSEVVWVMPDEALGLAALCSGAPMPGADVETLSIGVTIHPARRTDDLEDRLMAFAEEVSLKARKLPDLPAAWHRGVLARWTDRMAVCERRGYTAVRWFLELERSLLDPLPNAPAPAGIVLAPALDAATRAHVHHSIAESFQDHWNPVEFTFEQFEHFVCSPAMQPLQALLARAEDGEPAGACIVRVQREKNEQYGTREGDVSVLGVRRPFRGRGVARALLSSGLAWLRGQGIEVATITVDAESPTGADRLYASAGFTERRRSVVYEKAVLR